MRSGAVGLKPLRRWRSRSRGCSGGGGPPLKGRRGLSSCCAIGLRQRWGGSRGGRRPWQVEAEEEIAVYSQDDHRHRKHADRRIEHLPQPSRLVTASFRSRALTG